MSNKVYTFDDTESLARKAAGYVSRRYGRDGTDYDTALSDIHEWMYTPRNQSKVNRWLANTPQQVSRIYYSYLEAAQKPAERLRAERRGYEVGDVFWYTERRIRELLPLALNDEWDGQTGPDKERKDDLNEKAGKKRHVDHAETGNTLAEVVDIRRAISGLPGWVGLALRTDSGIDFAGIDSAAAVEAVLQYLGGQSPTVGSRRSVSNATAQAITGREYDGE